jgi:hypothetical protein
MAKLSTSCPICRKAAKQSQLTFGDYLEFDCSDCGHFQVSRTFQQIASKQPVSTRRQSLERARIRARYGSLPTVTTYLP